MLIRCRLRRANQWALDLTWSALIGQRLIQRGWSSQNTTFIHDEVKSGLNVWLLLPLKSECFMIWSLI